MDRQFILELEDYLARHWENILKSIEVDLDTNYAMMEENEYDDISIEAKPIEDYSSYAIPCLQQATYSSKEQDDIEDYIRRTKNNETFSTRLLKYIDESGMPDSEVYKKAGIDRRHFSKIRSNKDYQPRKQTVMALGLALKLKLCQMSEMLELAGFSLSSSDTGDLIIKFCIEKGKYDLMEVNEVLDYFGIKGLGV